MLIPALFFTASWIFGHALLEITQIIVHWPIRHIFALIIGTIINTLFIFVLALLFNLNLITCLTVLTITFIPSLFFLIKKNAFPNVFEDLEIKKNCNIALGFLFISVFIGIIFIKSLIVDSSGISAGNRLVWTDWPVHFAIISSFAKSDNFPPENPLYAGQIISYPFFADFLSSILQVLGVSLKTSIVFPSVVLSISSVFLVYYLGILITGKKSSAIVGLLVGLFWGGLGFLYFFSDLINSSNFFETLKFPLKEYTFYQEKNLWFFNFVYAELLPQRAFLFGLPMFLISLILLFIGLTNNKKSYLLVSGYIAGIMPFFHTHSYLSLLIISGSFILLTLITNFKNHGLEHVLRQIRNLLLYFASPIIGLGLIQLPIFLSIDLNQTIGFNWGWTKGTENFFVFWFKNTGLFWPLLIYSLLKIKTNPSAKYIGIASLILFVLPNIFRFAPWPYDNLKIMTYWYLISAFFVSASLIHLYNKGILSKIFVIILFVSLTLSGFMEVARILNTEKTKFLLWSREDQELANDLLEKTPPKSLVLTAAIHDHSSSALAGRKTIIGFPGNAWSWGLADWQQREIDVHAIFKGDPIYADFLLKKYNVDFVLISPREKFFEKDLNEMYFSQNYSLVSQKENYKIYKIR